MLIEDKRKTTLTNFSNIADTGIFEYDGEILMKLSEVVIDKSGVKCNTVMLRSGITYRLEDDNQCVLLSSKLIIDRYPAEE